MAQFNKFLPGEPVLVNTGKYIAYCFIRSHANIKSIIGNKAKLIEYTIEIQRPVELKGKLYSVPVNSISKIRDTVKTNWPAVKITCGWSPDSLQHKGIGRE